MKAIITDRLTRTFDKGKVTALHEVSLSVEQGEVFGLIGPDGAGKTTLIRILASLILPDSGSASLAGLDPVRDYAKVRQIIGYMPGKFSLYQDLSVQENLRFFATVFKSDLEANYHLIKDLYDQLAPFKNRRAGQLSGGMKQKLALCCALIHEPEILLLDEPTTGVDPVSRREFWDMLIRLKTRGITILVSTPYMDEANLCNRIALIQKGTILETGTPAEIRQRSTRPVYAVKSGDMYPLLRAVRDYPETWSCHTFGETHHVQLKSGTPQDLSNFLNGRISGPVSIEQIEPGIEDVFMDKLIGMA